MRNIKQEILNNSVRLFGQRIVSQHLYNDGKNKENLKQEKSLLLSELTKENINNLVKSKKHYPINDIMDIDLEIDLIVIDKETFDSIFNA